MPEPLPPEIQEFVLTQLATGDYRSEEDLVVEPLRAFRELKLRHQALLDELQDPISQAERGETHPLDTEATKAEARRRLNSR